MPFGLPGVSIVLEGFFGNMLRSEPRSYQEEVREKQPTNGYVVGWNCTGLSGQDL
jgi:hypothetical protein